MIRPPHSALLLALLVSTLPALSSAASKEEAIERARSLLLEDAQYMGLLVSDLDELVVTDIHTSRHNQVTHIYFKQRVNGIEVANGTLTLNLDRSGEVVSWSSRLVSNLAARVNSFQPELSRSEAIRGAAEQLGLRVEEPLDLLEDLGGTTREAIFSSSGISLDPITIKLAYYHTDQGEVRLTWEMLIRQTDQKHWWHLWLDAATGVVQAKVDWIANDTYQAYALPKESPSDGGRTVQMDPADATA